MILIDKGYFDYDFEKVAAPAPNWEDTILDEEQTENLLAMFGMGKQKKPETTEELQEYIIKQIKED